MRDSYWEERKYLSYYQEVNRLLNEFGPGNSILDIGSGGTPVATWGDFTDRHQCDKSNCKVYNGVKFHKCDWMDMKVEKKFDVITCLQVMEHLPNYEYVKEFSKKIVSNCRYAIFSVPINWGADVCKHHPLDPISFNDLSKFDYGKEWISYRLCKDKMKRAVWQVKCC